MCGCVAGVAGAALEAVVVFLLPVADAVYAVCLPRGELHALDVHLCTQKKNKTDMVVFSADENKAIERKLFTLPTVGIFIREPAAPVD